MRSREALLLPLTKDQQPCRQRQCRAQAHMQYSNKRYAVSLKFASERRPLAPPSSRLTE